MHRKRRCFAGAAAAIAAVTLCVPCGAVSWRTEYNQPEHCMVFKGDQLGGNYLCVRVTEYHDARQLAAADRIIEGENEVFKVFETRGGELCDAVIGLPESSGGTRYIYRCNTEAESENGIVFLIGPETEELLKGTATSVNAAGEAGLPEILRNSCIDNGDRGKDLGYIASLVYHFRPAGGYTWDGFTRAYMQSEGLAYVRQGVYRFKQLMEFYQLYIEEDVLEEYDSLTAQQKELLEGQASKEIVSDSFKTLLSEKLFLAKYSGAASVTELKKELLEQLSEWSVPLEDYNRISNSYYQEKVFAELFADKLAPGSKDEVIKAFHSAVSRVLESIEHDSPRGGGGGGGGGGRGGAGGGGAGGGSVGTVGAQAPDSPAERDAFSDVPGHWAELQITALNGMGILNGFEDGSFRPDADVTRAEFVKMLAGLLLLPEDSGKVFEDVADGDWFAGCVSAAYEAGIVLGYDGRFEPNKPISRQDAAVMLHRMLKIRGLSVAGEAMSIPYSDAGDIADYAADSVWELRRGGIMRGSAGVFLPLSNLTRAEAATALYNIIRTYTLEPLREGLL